MLVPGRSSCATNASCTVAKSSKFDILCRIASAPAVSPSNTTRRRLAGTGRAWKKAGVCALDPAPSIVSEWLSRHANSSPSRGLPGRNTLSDPFQQIVGLCSNVGSPGIIVSMPSSRCERMAKRHSSVQFRQHGFACDSQSLFALASRNTLLI